MLIPLWILAAGAASAETNEPTHQDSAISIGSKLFIESQILGEMLVHLANNGGLRADHTTLGGTQLVFKALVAGEIDAYVEYTGTISEEILAGQDIRDHASLSAALAKQGIRMSRPLGFNNTYVLGMREQQAAELDIQSISDLRNHPQLEFGLSNEFMDREDGWPSLRRRYNLPHQNVTGLSHDLAYRGIESQSIDVMDLYSTDAEIQYYELRPLIDDRHHFPAYQAVILYRDQLLQSAPRFVTAMLQLEGRISESDMIKMNSRGKIEKVAVTVVAADFLEDKLAITTRVRERNYFDRLLRYTAQHLYLVTLSLAAAVILAIPLGVIAAHYPALGQIVLGATGILQVIPSLALLVFMIPLLGTKAPPAIAALFLYSLLPIVRNTHAGLMSIPSDIRESAEALGLPATAQLWKIKLPLASRSILAGIKTSAVINVGTATLGGFIGAGGYGEPIFTGIVRDDLNQILYQGALPAAVMALVVQGLFELAERWCVPKGLRIPRPT